MRSSLTWIGARTLTGAMVALMGCSGGESTEAAETRLLDTSTAACRAAAEFDGSACVRDCGRFPDDSVVASCTSACETESRDGADGCGAVVGVEGLGCAAPSACADAAETCREDASDAYDGCSESCGDDPTALRCRIACDKARASDERSCGFSTTPVGDGPVEVVALTTGRPANLEVLLDDAEMAVVEAADARAETFRTRPVRIHIGAPGTEVRLNQTEHGFEFGFPVDFREFRDEPEDLDFYGRIARENTTLMVAETALKWRQLEPEPGRLEFDLGDSELAWADENGFKVKMHTLLWGNAPPFSTGSGTPEWLREQFPDRSPSEEEQAELRSLIRTQAEAVVARYRGRIDIYDVTNETLNPLTSWFADRLGPGIVDDLFRWVRAVDPGAQLVLNEWISEVFTGFEDQGAATAAIVRDRVLELIEAGVPIDAIGQQAHFAPVLLFAGGADLDNPDLGEPTRVDDYAEALDTLAEAGLPIHITETTFNVPDEPEARAAHAEAMMRVWWGNEAVEEIVFWSLWNKVAARNQLQHGIYDDTRDGTLTRHGEAILSLLNDRWRTNEVLTSDDDGTVELRATLGEYVAQWEEDGEIRHVTFQVGPGESATTVIAIP
ncbi:MAG: endo-1,4-beta-xylanase [Myxococcota bacterium]